MKVACLLVVILCFSAVICMVKNATTEGKNTTNQKRKNPETAGSVTEGFQISARAENESVISGTPVRLRIRIKNVSNKALYLGEAGVEHDYRVRISTDTGKTIPLTTHGRSILEGGRFYMNLSILMKPGQEREDIFELGNIYDMTL